MANLLSTQSPQFSIGERVQYVNQARQETLVGTILQHNVRDHTYKLELEDKGSTYKKIIPEEHIWKIAKKNFPKPHAQGNTSNKNSRKTRSEPKHNGSAAELKFDRRSKEQSNSYRSFNENRTSAWGSGRNRQTQRSDSRLLEYNKQITTAGRERNLTKAERIFDSIFKNKLTPDAYTYTALMNAAIKSRNSPRAFQLFDTMREAGIQPDTVTYTTLMNAAIHTGNNERAFQLFDAM